MPPSSSAEMSFSIFCSFTTSGIIDSFICLERTIIKVYTSRQVDESSSRNECGSDVDATSLLASTQLRRHFDGM